MTSTTGHELVPWTDSFALLKQCDDEDAGVELWDFSERRTPSNENDIPDGKKKRNADSFLYRRSRFILAKPRPPRGGARNIMSYLADVGGRMARHAVITRGGRPHREISGRHREIVSVVTTKKSLSMPQSHRHRRAKGISTGMESESIHNNKVVNVLIRIYWKGATQHELSDRKNHKGNDRRDYLGGLRPVQAPQDGRRLAPPFM